LLDNDFNWVILLEGCFLMLIILAGVYFIFVYWNKQARLNRLQSNFISSVSHELKSPLASIQLYLETLKYQEVSAEETRDFVETMLADTVRLSTLIENIFEASRSDPKSMQLRFQPIEVKAFLREVLAGFKPQLDEKGCAPVITVEDAPVLHIDKRAMRMVLNNLIGNALRYSPAGAGLAINVKMGKKYCDIEVADSGIGLEKKDMKKIFKKFYRVQNEDTHNIEGAGLGLYISKEIVRSHKGKIQVRSEGRGKGTTFIISLPLDGGCKEQKVS
jgi:signal transduction histidine kinase